MTAPTLRQQYAMAAVAGYMSDNSRNNHSYKQWAGAAFAMADAMIEHEAQEAGLIAGATAQRDRLEDELEQAMHRFARLATEHDAARMRDLASAYEAEAREVLRAVRGGEQ